MSTSGPSTNTPSNSSRVRAPLENNCDEGRVFASGQECAHVGPSRVDDGERLVFTHEHPELGATESDDVGAAIEQGERDVAQVVPRRVRHDTLRELLEDNLLQSVDLGGRGYQ